MAWAAFLAHDEARSCTSPDIRIYCVIGTRTLLRRPQRYRSFGLNHSLLRETPRELDDVTDEMLEGLGAVCRERKRNYLQP